ncbi:MAG TPA: hypothetical protein VM074_04260 [Solimonas sp.]|nr:hypothetical protein [Solimonas sp.]
MWRVIYLDAASGSDEPRGADADNGVAALSMARALLAQGHTVLSVCNANGETVLDRLQLTALFGSPAGRDDPSGGTGA